MNKNVYSFFKFLITVMLLFASLFGMFNVGYADGVVVAFEQLDYSVLLGQSITVKPVIQGTKQKGSYSFNSEDESIATVNNKGVVKTVSVGNTVINCNVDIKGDIYSCSYILNVEQPVTEIQISETSFNIPHRSSMYFPEITVLPDNATHKGVSYSSSNPKIASVTEDGWIYAYGTGNVTITCTATDGSKTKASIKITVPKVAWTSVGKEVEITSPEGVDVYYAHVFDRGINFGNYSCSGCIEVEYSKTSEEFLNQQVFKTMTNDVEHVILKPVKVGKGKFTISSNGKKLSITVNVKRSSVYENAKYASYEKNEQKYLGLRFQTEGTVAGIDKRESNSCITLFVDEERTKLASVTVPNNLLPAMLKEGENIIVYGVFDGIQDYTTETGLANRIPSFTAEKITVK